MRRYTRHIVGTPLFFGGWYFFFVSTHMLLTSEAGVTRIITGGVFGLLAVLVGGWLLSPIIAQQIGDYVFERIRPFLDYLPGGRRRTDPPAQIPPAPPDDTPGIG